MTIDQYMFFTKHEMSMITRIREKDSFELFHMYIMMTLLKLMREKGSAFDAHFGTLFQEFQEFNEITQMRTRIKDVVKDCKKLIVSYINQDVLQCSNMIEIMRGYCERIREMISCEERANELIQAFKARMYDEFKIALWY
jgi:hypothetical protein